MMRANIGAILFVVTLCALATWYFAATRADMPRRILVEQARQETYDLMRKDRISEWATVIREKEISPGEGLKLVTISDEFGISSSHCLIYTNVMFRTAQFVCPH